MNKRLLFLPLLFIFFIFLSGCTSVEPQYTDNDKTGMDIQEIETVIQNGHSEWINCIAVSPDGKYIATAGSDKIIKIRDAETGLLLRNIEGHSKEINALAFHPSEGILASAGKDRTIFLWNVETGELVRFISTDQFRIVSVAFTQNGKKIISGGRDEAVKVWDYTTGELLQTLNGHTKIVYSVAASPDNSMVATGGEEETIKLWDIEKGTLIREIQTPGRVVKCLEFSPDGKKLVSAGSEIIVWNTGTWRPFRVLDRSRTNSVTFSPDGTRIASGGEYGEVKLWDAERGFLIKSRNRHRNFGRQSVNSVTFTPDGDNLISGGYGMVLIWKGEDLELVRDLEGFTTWVYTLAFNSDGTRLVNGGLDDKLKLFDLTTGEIHQTQKLYSRGVCRTAISPDGTILASAMSKENIVRIWDEAASRMVTTLYGHTSQIAALSFSPDGSMLATGSSDKTIRIWDTSTWKLLKTLVHSSLVQTVRFSPDGHYIAAGDFTGGIIHVWTVHDWKKIKTFDVLHIVNSIAFSPDSARLAAGDDGGNIFVWDVESGEIVMEIENGWFRNNPFGNINNPIHSIDFCPSSNTIISGNDDGTVKIWDAGTGDLVKTLKAHTGKVVSVACCSGRAMFATGGWDGIISFWNAETFELLFSTLNFNPKKKYAQEQLIWSPEGYFTSTNKDAYSLVTFETENRIYGIDQFAVMKNRPDIILEKLGTFNPELVDEYHYQYLKRLIKFELLPVRIPHEWGKRIIRNSVDSDKKLFKKYYTHGFTLKKRYMDQQRIPLPDRYRLLKIPIYLEYIENFLESGLHIPQADIAETKRIDDKHIQLAIRFSDIKYPLRSYNIYVNGVPLYGIDGKEIEESQNDITVEEIIELNSGKNRIEALCFNNKMAESLRETVFASYTQETFGDLYFIGFGVSEYSDEAINDLGFADNDINDLARLFSEMEGRYYKNVHILTRTDEAVTKESIGTAQTFISDSSVDDTLIVAVAGHGIHDTDPGSTYYFITHDTQLENLSENAAPFELIEGLFNSADKDFPRKKLLLLDTCQSGDVDPRKLETEQLNNEGNRGVARSLYTGNTLRGLKKKSSSQRIIALHSRNRFIFSDIARRTGTIVFSSSTGNEFSYEDSVFKNGLFTEGIIRAFSDNTADRDKNRSISFDELALFVQTFVHEQNDKQNPRIDTDNIYMNLQFPAER